MAAISYDSVSVLGYFSSRQNIRYPLLSDEQSSVIRAFGILNRTVPASSPFFGIPNPVTYIVDARGVIQSVRAEEDYRTRLTTGAILGEAAPPSQQRFAGKKINVTASASDSVVRGSERVRLFLELQLPPKIHVYAPGVEGYIPVRWTMENTSAQPVGDVAFPPAKKIRLSAINETVPAYTGTVSIARDVLIADSRELEKHLDANGALKINGTLRYQACDDTTCYVPEDVPVVWSFKYVRPDTTRVPQELRRKAPAKP